jgi:triacylglycerol lipase
MSRVLALVVAALAALPVASAAAQSPGVSPPGANDFGCTPPAAHPEPVVLVHGTFADMTISWNTISAVLVNDGYCVFALDYGDRGMGPIADSAQELATFVDSVLAATGAAKADVVGHSQGGMMPRYYVKNLGGDAKVDEWVSLGGPNHGTDTANFCFSTACSEMRIGSSFLAALNSGDETPGAVSYRTWWSPCDSVINPDSSVSLSGATNTKTACLSHGDLHENATVYAQVRDFVR